MNSYEPEIGAFYSPIIDDCICYYDMNYTNKEGITYYKATITDGLKEFNDQTRKSAIYTAPGYGTDCSRFSNYRGMTRDDMSDCGNDAKVLFLEEISWLKGE